MELLLIPGEGRDSNEQWLKEITNRLAQPSDYPFGRITTIPYVHWSMEGEEFNPLHELHRLQDFLVRRNDDDPPYFVFAKSAGSVLFLQAIADGAPKPVGAVFAGLPLPQDGSSEMYKMFDIGRLLRGYSVPTVIIQNETERFRRPDILRASLAAWGVTSCEVATGTDPGHTYSVDTVVHHVLAQAERVAPR